MIGYLFARELLRDILELFDNKGEKLFYLNIKNRIFLTVFAYSLINKFENIAQQFPRNLYPSFILFRTGRFE